MLEFTTDGNPSEQTAEERIELFKVDGKPYYMPARVGMEIGLRYMKAMRTQDQMTVTGVLFEEVIGTEAYDALCGVKGLRAEDLKTLMDGVMGIVMGQLEDATGN